LLLLQKNKVNFHIDQWEPALDLVLKYTRQVFEAWVAVMLVNNAMWTCNVLKPIQHSTAACRDKRLPIFGLLGNTHTITNPCERRVKVFSGLEIRYDTKYIPS